MLPATFMGRHVRGTLFVDYVRMLRARKDLVWSKRLPPDDVAYLTTAIVPDQWYPMETFERFGIQILEVVAGGHRELVQEWGRSSIDGLKIVHPELISEGDVRESLMKFHVLRNGFFDYPALTVCGINDGEASLEISYQMGAVAEEAASLQTMGFFERLLELAGARRSRVWFGTQSWTGAAVTTLDMTWE